MRAVIYPAFDDHIETFQMSEEELSEGSLGLRARGSSRATSHGQVLIRESDNDGEREVPEEEGLEEEEVCEALLQLLERDLLACDVQLSLFVAAATSYRHVRLVPWFLQLSFLISRTQRCAPSHPPFSPALGRGMWRECRLLSPPCQV